MVQIDFTRGWQIVVSSSDPVAALAMTELATTLKRVTGQSFEIVARLRPEIPQIVLEHRNEQDDGFRWLAVYNRIELQGHNPRGLLYAVYDFLEALGCRWVARFLPAMLSRPADVCFPVQA